MKEAMNQAICLAEGAAETLKLKTITMGKPILTPALIPVKHAATPHCINEPFMIDGTCCNVTCMSFGSPHGAVYVDDLESETSDPLARALAVHPLFPEGAAIVLFHMESEGQIKARVWQHSGEEVPYSPEAACVALVSSVMLHKSCSTEATIAMCGAAFKVKWDRFTDTVTLAGPTDILEGKPV